MRKRFSADASVGEQFREIASTELRAALKAAAEPGKTARERVHAARTHTKKLRALLRMVKSEFPGFGTENATARDAARLLAPLRDAAVLEQTLHRLQDDTTDPMLGAAELGRMIDARMPDIAGQLEELTAFTRAIMPMLDRAVDWRLGQDKLSVLTDGTTRTYKAGRRAMTVARRSGEPGDFHEWRKQVKHQAYELGFLRELPGAPVSRIKKLKSLAGLLGLHHDYVVFAAFAAGEGHKFAPLIEAASAERDSLERKALRLGKQLFHQPPRKWRSKLFAGDMANI